MKILGGGGGVGWGGWSLWALRPCIIYIYIYSFFFFYSDSNFSRMAIRQIYTLTLLLLADWLIFTVCVKTVVDLTHGQDVSTLYWPGNVDFNFTIIARGLTKQGYWYVLVTGTFWLDVSLKF